MAVTALGDVTDIKVSLGCARALCRGRSLRTYGAHATSRVGFVCASTTRLGGCGIWRWRTQKKLRRSTVTISAASIPATTVAVGRPHGVVSGVGFSSNTVGVTIAIVVPFRDQKPLQDRQAQLQRFLGHMEVFLASLPGFCSALVLVVEQMQDGRRFNRGQLLNVGFRIAQKALPSLDFFIMHDVDLLPSKDMSLSYASPPVAAGAAIHLASVWPKYKYDTFIGGVLAFRPDDFERVNGYPNDYWGWGLEDDQLSLRMAHQKIQTVKVHTGSFDDLDPINMKSILDRGHRHEVKDHLPWYNPEMFRSGRLILDTNWFENGLSNLAYTIERTVDHSWECVIHHVVRLKS
eukprot:TRINITY_DN27819_c0_g1_i1.p1 TRINITY_DN27819_c0_g1~~TRINITY_DN27819_c0_g1_i1.p1  ORF type:complete len:372 (+),score=48.32 TRINITY_DN27819_c0_g1_i1:75-1118(+)